LKWNVKEEEQKSIRRIKRSGRGGGGKGGAPLSEGGNFLVTIRGTRERNGEKTVNREIEANA